MDRQHQTAFSDTTWWRPTIMNGKILILFRLIIVFIWDASHSLNQWIMSFASLTPTFFEFSDTSLTHGEKKRIVKQRLAQTDIDEIWSNMSFTSCRFTFFGGSPHSSPGPGRHPLFIKIYVGKILFYPKSPICLLQLLTWFISLLPLPCSPRGDNNLVMTMRVYPWVYCGERGVTGRWES